MKNRTLAAALALALLPAAVLAQSTTPSATSPELVQARAKVRAACAEDVQKFCADIERGKGARRACLDQHQNDLSAACSTARAERAAAKAAEKM